MLAPRSIVLFSVRYLEIAEEKRGSYYALLLFACVGMMLMVSGVDVMIAMFLGLEILCGELFSADWICRSPGRR